MTADLVCVTRAIDDPGPLLDRVPAREGVAWVTGHDGLVGAGTALRVDAPASHDRVAVAESAFSQLVGRLEVIDEVGGPGTGPVAFGSFTFDPAAVGSVLVVPEVVVGRQGSSSWVTRIGPADEVAAAFDADPLPPVTHPEHAAEADRPRHAGASVPDVRWLEAVAAAVERIEPAHVRHLTSTSLAGTAPRSDDPDEDERLGRDLLASDKDRREHALLVDEVATQLEGRLAAVSHGAEPHLLRLDNVQHLATRFVGELREDDDASALQLADWLHPTPAVGGVPTARALELIDTVEGLERGRYAGPVGWVDADGDGQWGIALRCAEVHGARARLFAGAGIVAGSLPEAELEETRVKLRAMRSAFAG